MTTIESTLDAVPRDTARSGFQGRSGGRAIRNEIARIVMWAAFLIAMIPLVWILGSVVVKGGQLLLASDWWTNSQRGVTARHVGGGAVHAIQGTLIEAAATALIAVTTKSFVNFICNSSNRREMIGVTSGRLSYKSFSGRCQASRRDRP